MSSLFRILQKSDSILRLYGTAKRAAEGDADARVRLRSDGLYEIAEIWRDGGGAAARAAVTAAKEVWSPADPNVIDGEYREVTSTPWEGFVRRLISQPNSANIIVGPTGSGKTQLAIKLAERFSERHGYVVNWCGLYPDDVPDFGKVISVGTLVKRMEQLRRYLAVIEDEDEEDVLDEEPSPKEGEQPKGAPSLPPCNRVVVIDEVGMNLSTSAHDPARKAALRALASCRHTRWHVIWIGQQLGQFPMGLIAQSIVWIQRPDGRELGTDRMDVPLVRSLWAAASEGHEAVRRSVWYADQWKHPKAWSYVDAQSVNGQPGYQGMVPHEQYRVAEKVEADAKEDDD